MTLNVAEETKLRLTLDLVNRTGLQRGAVTLRDDLGAEWVHLYEFMVYPRVGFVAENPQIHWSNVEPLQPLSHEVEFAAYGRKREELPSDADFRVEGGPMVEVAEARITPETDGFWSRRFKLKISHVAPPQAGPISGAIVGKCVMNGKEEIARLAVTGFVRSLLMVTPEYLFFAAGDGPKKVVVRRTDGKPLHCSVQPPQAGKPALRAEVLATANPAIAFVQIAPPANLDQPFWAELHLATNHEKQASIKIPVSAFPRTSPQPGTTTQEH